MINPERFNPFSQEKKDSPAEKEEEQEVDQEELEKLKSELEEVERKLEEIRKIKNKGRKEVKKEDVKNAILRVSEKSLLERIRELTSEKSDKKGPQRVGSDIDRIARLMKKREKIKEKIEAKKEQIED